MRKLKSLGILAILSALALVASATPASAAGIGGVSFVGRAQISRGLYYPVLGGGDGVGAGWSLSASVCAGVEASLKKPGVVNAALCSLNFSGSLNAGASGLGAWCGLSGGSGSGSIAIGSNVFVVNSVQWVQSVAANILFSGSVSKGGQSGPLAGDAIAVPDVSAGESCLPGPGADLFIVVGIGFAVAL